MIPRPAAFALLLAPVAAWGRAPEAWQERWYDALVRQAVISPDTKLVTLSFVCTLDVDGHDWRVLDVVEHVPGAMVPRGHNQIVLLDRHHRVVRALDYADEHPMACRGATLYVHGDYGVDDAGPYGNTLTFDAAGGIVVTSTEANDLPIPLTRARAGFRDP